MVTQYSILQPQDVQASIVHQGFGLDVLLGLSQSPKYLSSKYFYDTEGNRLFQQITQLPEYYLTQCELEIFQSHKQEIAEVVGGRRFNLVELGAGDGQKTKVLLEHFLRTGLDFRYVPVDICEVAVQELVEELQQCSPQLQIEGLVAEYFDGLKWLSTMNDVCNVVLFLGSNIGNFSRTEARVFLHSLWNTLNDGDYLLIGFDLKKDIEKLASAYNDSTGVTAQFNLNLLRRVNRELGGDFDLNQFQFYSTYNVFSGAMESCLVSCERQVVHIKALNQSFVFEPWEPLHTEYSHKYLQSKIALLAEETGFKVVSQLLDSKQYFADFIWQVKKGRVNL